MRISKFVSAIRNKELKTIFSSSKLETFFHLKYSIHIAEPNNFIRKFSNGNEVEVNKDQINSNIESEVNKKDNTNTSEDSFLSSGLPLPQRCKNLLLSNWRGQLSTVKTNSEQKDESSIHGTLVPYALIEGKPIIWLPKEDKHEVNLLFDDRGSLVVGHTDPMPLVEVFCASKKMPPRTILLGDLIAVDSTENDYLCRRILKAAESTSSAIEKSGPNLRSILENSGNVLNDRIRVLSALAHSPSSFSLYRLYARTCNYVDVCEGRHSVTMSDVISAASDPLATLMNGLVESVNRNPQKRGALVIFCAAYLQIQVKDAFLFSADRWGFNILGLPGDPTEKDKIEDSNVQWREFRFAFSEEVNDAESFCLLLNEMEKEVMDTMQEVDGEQQNKEAKK